MSPHFSDGQNSFKKVCVDIISSLPEDILHYILSFLSTKNAIQTSVLSRKWQYLWTSIPNINMDFSHSQSMEHIDFVDTVLSLHDDSDIKRLRLKFPLPMDFSRLHLWISVAIKHNVEELDLDLYLKTVHSLPCLLFTCSSLVVLKICGDFLLKAPLRTCLLNLKKLYLSQVTFPDELSTQRLFSGCPVLEDLTLAGCFWEQVNYATISIPTLRRLAIDHGSQCMVNCLIKISAVNLAYLEYSSDLFVEFYLCDISSLDHASVDFMYDIDWFEDVLSRAYSLFLGIRNVKFLRVSEDCLWFMNNVPVFPSLNHLEFDSDFSNVEAGLLIQLLRRTPKLEFLNFPKGFCNSFSDNDLMPEGVPSCFNTSLKKLSISDFWADPDVIKFLRFVLRYATALESLILYWSDDLSYDEKMIKAIRYHLCKLPKGSERCVIELL